MQREQFVFQSLFGGRFVFPFRGGPEAGHICRAEVDRTGERTRRALGAGTGRPGRAACGDAQAMSTSSPRTSRAGRSRPQAPSSVPVARAPAIVATRRIIVRHLPEARARPANRVRARGCPARHVRLGGPDASRPAPGEPVVYPLELSMLAATLRPGVFVRRRELLGNVVSCWGMDMGQRPKAVRRAMHTSRRRLFLAICLAMILAGVLVGCGTSSNTAAQRKNCVGGIGCTKVHRVPVDGESCEGASESEVAAWVKESRKRSRAGYRSRTGPESGIQRLRRRDQRKTTAGFRHRTAVGRDTRCRAPRSSAGNSFFFLEATTGIEPV